MKKLIVLLAFGTATIAGAPLALARQAPPPAATAPAPAAPAAAPAPSSQPVKLTKVEDHIKSLHAKLGIKPDQEPKFEALAQAMRDQAKAMYAARERDIDTTMTAPQEMQRYADMAQAHADATKQLLPAFQAMYDSLSDGQKKKADALFSKHDKAAASH